MINAWREGRFCNPPGREGSVYLSWAVILWGGVRAGWRLVLQAGRARDLSLV